MISLRILATIQCLCLMLLVTPFSAQSAEPAIIDGSKVIGVIPITKAGVTQSVYRQIDALVPALKKIQQEKIVKLECRYIGAAEREQDVHSAYMIAAKVEKYLRDRHKLNLDLWVAAHIGKNARDYQQALTFSVFTDDMKKLDKLPVVPAGRNN